MTNTRVRENRLRRAANRQRLKLVKSKRRDRRAFNFDRAALVDLHTNEPVFGHDHTGAPVANLDEIEAYLNGEYDHADLRATA